MIFMVREKMPMECAVQYTGNNVWELKEFCNLIYGNENELYLKADATQVHLEDVLIEKGDYVLSVSGKIYVVLSKSVFENNFEIMCPVAATVE